MRRLNNEQSILAFDHSAVDKSMNDWNKEREKKGNVFRSYGEYIQFLEEKLEYEDDNFQKYIIQKEIKKLKKEQKKYYVPSVLEMADFSLIRSRDDSENSLEKSSFSLVEKVKTRSRKRS